MLGVTVEIKRLMRPISQDQAENRLSRVQTSEIVRGLMDQPKAILDYLPIKVATFLAVVLALVCGFLGQRAWSHQTLLTKNFEACMEAAPFKHPRSEARTEAAVMPESLPKHFEDFDQMFRDTGLPPIWNGNKLVPWKVFHKESILFAKQCHEQLGIIRPQNELRGTYSKPVWDPSSNIWQTN